MARIVVELDLPMGRATERSVGVVFTALEASGSLRPTATGMQSVNFIHVQVCQRELIIGMSSLVIGRTINTKLLNHWKNYFHWRDA